MSEQIKSNNNMTESIKPKLPQISYQDLIKFKEELLKELRDYKYQTTLNINNEIHKFEKLIENKNVITNFIEKEKLSLLSKSEFSNERNIILSQISNKEQEIRNKLVVTDAKLNNYKRDVEESIYRYDKIIVENLQIPGLVGNACKYPNLKEYILANKEELNNSSMISKQASMELKSFKKKTEMNISIMNEKISEQKYKLLNLINSKFNEVSEKFEGLYTALNEKIANMDHGVNNEKEILNQEIKKLNDLIFENKNKIIEENNISKAELLTEINEIKKNFDKIKKNIINLANLLMGKNNKQNKKAIIDNFNNMTMDLFKDINIDNINLENNNVHHFNKNNNDNIRINRQLKKKYTLQNLNDLDKNVIKPYVKSSVKSYIEGKISAKDTKFTGGNQRRSSVQINDFSLLKFQSQIKNNSSSSDVPKVHQKRKLNKRYSQIIINKSDLNQNLKNKKKIKRGNSLSFKQKEAKEKENYFNERNYESYNNNINLIDKKMNDDNEIINEEDSNKFSSSGNSSNTKKLDKRHSLNCIEFKNNKGNHKNKNNESKKINDFDSSEMSSSTKKIDNSLDSSKFIYNNENNENENQGRSNRNNIAPLNMDNLNQNFNEKLNNIRNINNYTLYEAITKNLLTNLNYKQDLDEKKIENEKTDLTETNINNKLNKSINNNNNNALNQTDINTNENINNNSIKLNPNFKNNNQLSIKEKINDKPTLLFEKKGHQQSKIKLKKNIDIKYLKENINGNYLTLGTLGNIKKKNDIIDTTPKINKTIKGNLRTMSIQNSSNSKLNEKNILSPSKYFNSTLYKNNLMIKTTRNKNINTIMNSINEKEKYFSSFDLQKNNINKNRNIDNIMKRLTEKKIDGFKLNLNHINKDKDDKDIYLDKEVFKNIRFIKDEEIIDRPLLFDRNTFNIDKNKGLLENKILELEFFTKKKFDELVNEIKHFIPIHFNSHLKNYSVTKK